MSENDMTTPFLIIGAGIGGLYLANLLKKQKKEFLLIEKTERWGGNIDVHKQSDPTIFLGPKIFLASRAGVLKKLAIEKNIPFRIIKENKERFIYSEGKLLNVKKLVLPYVLKYLFKAPFLKKINTEQTFEEYFLPRIGKKGVDLLLDPILHGIYAEGPKLLSLDALWPFFKQKKSLKNLFKKKEKGLFLFENGPFELIEKLKEEIHSNIRLNTECQKIVKDELGFRVETSNGVIFTKKIVLATEFVQTQELLKNSDLLQEGFDQLKSTSVDVVHFVFGKRQLRPKGSGFLIPQKEGFKILGALFDFDLRQIKEGDLLSVFIKGAKNPKEEALFELKKVFKKLDEPTAILHTCYKDKIFKCQKGNLNAIQNQEKFLKAKGIFLLGAYPRVGVADVLEKADEVNKEALFLS